MFEGCFLFRYTVCKAFRGTAKTNPGLTTVLYRLLVKTHGRVVWDAPEYIRQFFTNRLDAFQYSNGFHPTKVFVVDHQLDQTLTSLVLFRQFSLSFFQRTHTSTFHSLLETLQVFQSFVGPFTRMLNQLNLFINSVEAFFDLIQTLVLACHGITHRQNAFSHLALEVEQLSHT
ncbi:hypothetical protein D3C87_1474580 [compost metagenome]